MTKAELQALSVKDFLQVLNADLAEYGGMLSFEMLEEIARRLELAEAEEQVSCSAN